MKRAKDMMAQGSEMTDETLVLPLLGFPLQVCGDELGCG